jgi:hypothetical protein
MRFARIRTVSTLLNLSVAMFVAGCSSSVPDAPGPTTDTGQRKGGETDTEKCRRKLATAIQRLTPERMATQDDPERSVNGLNAWIASCASDQAEAMKTSDETLSLLNNSARVTAGRFSGVDALYVRDSLMMRDLYQSLSRQFADADVANRDVANRDVARVMQAFAWATRNISLLPSDDSRPPLGLFDIVMTGFGTAEDRTWAFAELLRQQQIDAVIVSTAAEPKSEGTDLDTAAWIVAVIRNDDGLLFDVANGVPITVDEISDAANPVAAKLSVLKAHERWKESTVQVIGQVATFSPRMLVLQDQLSAEDSAVLFEELTGGVSDIRPLTERVMAAGGDLWSIADIAVWPHPEDRVIRSNSLTEEELGDYKQLMRPFAAPFERDVLKPESAEERTSVPEEMTDEERYQFAQQRMMERFQEVTKSTDKLFGKPSYRLLKARTQQVLGVTDTSIIQQLQQIRLTSLDEMIEIQVPDEVLRQFPGMPKSMAYELPAVIQNVNRSSTGSSMYWTALSQLDRGETGVGISTMTNYRNQYPDGQWKYPSLINQATALLSLDRSEEAMQALKDANVADNPEQRRVQRLLNALGAEAVAKPESEVKN